jgi:hypothetical protein
MSKYTVLSSVFYSVAVDSAGGDITAFLSLLIRTTLPVPVMKLRGLKVTVTLAS